MKKTTLLLLVLALCTATAAQAENKLMPTDLLNQKQVDLQYDFGYAYEKQMGLHTTDSAFAAGLGLGHGFDLHATTSFKHGGYGIENDSFRDLNLNLKYRQNLVKLPFTLVVGLGTKLNTSQAKASTIESFSPSLALGTVTGSFMPYLSFAAAIDRSAGVRNTYSTMAGTEYHLSRHLSFEGMAGWMANGKLADSGCTNDFMLEGNAKYEIRKNLYLIPKVGVQIMEESMDHSYSSVLKTGASVYYLW